MSSDEELAEHAASDDHDSEASEPAPEALRVLSTTGVRRFSWARAENFGWDLSARPSKLKRVRSGGTFKVDDFESDTFFAHDGIDLHLSGTTQRAIDALGGMQFSSVVNRTRQQDGARKTSALSLHNTMNAIHEVHPHASIIAPSRAGRLGRYGRFVDVAEPVGATSDRQTCLNDHDLGIARRGADSVLMSTLARAQHGTEHKLGVTAVGKTIAVIDQVFAFLWEARRTHEAGGVVVVTAHLTSLVQHLRNEFTNAASRLSAEDRNYATIAHYKDTDIPPSTRILFRTHLSPALPELFKNAPAAKKPRLLLVSDEDEKSVRRCASADRVYRSAASEFIKLREKASKRIYLGADLTSSVDYRTFLRETSVASQTHFALPALTPAHVSRRVMCFRDYDADLFLLTLFDVAQRALDQPKGAERPLFMAAAHRDMLGSIGVAGVATIPWTRQTRVQLKHRAFFCVVAFSGANSQRQKRAVVDDLGEVIRLERVATAARIRAQWPEWDGALVPLVLYSSVFECGMSMQIAPFGVVILDGANDAAECLWQMLMRSGREEHSTDLLPFGLLLLRSCGADDARGRAERANDTVTGMEQRDAARERIDNEIQRHGRTRFELPISTELHSAYVHAKRSASTSHLRTDGEWVGEGRVDKVARRGGGASGGVTGGGRDTDLDARVATCLQNVRACHVASSLVNRDPNLHVGVVLAGLAAMGHGVALVQRADRVRYKPRRLLGMASHALYGDRGLHATFDGDIVSHEVMRAVVARNESARLALENLPSSHAEFDAKLSIERLRTAKDATSKAQYNVKEAALTEAERDVISAVAWTHKYAEHRLPPRGLTPEEEEGQFETLWTDLSEPLAMVVAKRTVAEKTLFTRCLFATLNSQQSWQSVRSDHIIAQFCAFASFPASWRSFGVDHIEMCIQLNLLGLLHGNPIGELVYDGDKWKVCAPSVDLELLKRFDARERDDDVRCLLSRLQEPQFSAIDSKSAVKCIGKFFEWCGFVLDLKSEVPKLTPKWPHVFVDTYHLGKYTEVDLRSRHPTLTKEAATLSDALQRIPAQLNCTAASFRTNSSESAPIQSLLKDNRLSRPQVDVLLHDAQALEDGDDTWHVLNAHVLHANRGASAQGDAPRPWRSDFGVSALQTLEPSALDALLNDAASICLAMDDLPMNLANALDYAPPTAPDELYGLTRAATNPDALRRAQSRAFDILMGRCESALGHAMRARCCEVRALCHFPHSLSNGAHEIAPATLLAVIAHFVLDCVTKRACEQQDGAPRPCGLVGMLNGRAYFWVPDNLQLTTETLVHSYIPPLVTSLASPHFVPPRLQPLCQHRTRCANTTSL